MIDRIKDGLLSFFMYIHKNDLRHVIKSVIHRCNIRSREGGARVKGKFNFYANENIWSDLSEFKGQRQPVYQESNKSH